MVMNGGRCVGWRERIVGLKRRKQNGELGFVLEALYMYSRKEEQKGRRKMDRMNENGGQ